MNVDFEPYGGCGFTVYPGTAQAFVGASSFSLNTPGASGSNEFCTVFATGSSIVRSGDQLTLTIQVTFTPSFAGTHPIEAHAWGSIAGASARRLGSWTVPGSSCTYGLISATSNFAIAGGSGTVNVFAPAGCAWTASSAVGWLTITGGLSGSGSGVVAFTVSANGTGSQRTALIMAGGQALAVAQSSLPPQFPVLALTKTHLGSFLQGQTGATYTLLVSNHGVASTTGTVTVTETVPAGLTVASMTGMGWSCPAGGSTCARSDGLPAGTDYPAITVSVNVGANAGSPQVNSAAVAGGGSASASATDSTMIIVPGPPLRFISMSPCRVVDTRNPIGIFGGPQLPGGAARDFVIPSGACAVPASAEAYSLNVAAIPGGSLGFLTLWPAGQAQPVTSTLNSLDGRIKSNAAIVPGGAGGAISVFASNPTHLVVDINGYFVRATDPTALAFYPVTPCRVADTRNPAAPLGGPSLAAGVRRTFAVTSALACNIPSTARAYSLNFAAVPKGPLGYLTAWPSGQGMPLAASLNALTATVTANAAIVPAGTGGAIDIFASNATDLVIDINGYFAPAISGGLSLYTVTPCRVLDTRQPAGASPFSGQRDVPVVAAGCAIPASARAHVVSATVVPPGPLGYLTLWAQGESQPTVASLNALDGAVTSNLAIVPTANGSMSSFSSNPVHLVLDIFGYFAP